MKLIEQQSIANAADANVECAYCCFALYRTTTTTINNCPQQNGYRACSQAHKLICINGLRLVIVHNLDSSCKCNNFLLRLIGSSLHASEVVELFHSNEQTGINIDHHYRSMFKSVSLSKPSLANADWIKVSYTPRACRPCQTERKLIASLGWADAWMASGRFGWLAPLELQ